MEQTLSREAFEILCAKEKAGRCNQQELEALEPYRVRRAVFLAAGFGSRMRPVTLNTPKPMVRVHGRRLIEGLIEACLAADIRDIVVVRGYLAEEFELLRLKYPQIRFLDNALYKVTNNISSAVLAAGELKNAYLFEADLLMNNPSVIRKYEFEPNFLGFPLSHCDDWCFRVEKGRILSHQKGGDDCYQQVGISYWDEASGRRLAAQLKETFDSYPGGRDLFWEKVPLGIKWEDYRVMIRECSPEDVVEIDSFEELKALDEAYNC